MSLDESEDSASKLHRNALDQDGPLPREWNSQKLNGAKLIFVADDHALDNSIDYYASTTTPCGQKRKAAQNDQPTSANDSIKKQCIEKGVAVFVQCIEHANDSSKKICELIHEFCGAQTANGHSMGEQLLETIVLSWSRRTGSIDETQDFLWVHPWTLAKAWKWYSNILSKFCSKTVSSGSRNVTVVAPPGQSRITLLRLIKYVYGWRPASESLSARDIAWMISEKTRRGFALGPDFCHTMERAMMTTKKKSSPPRADEHGFYPTSEDHLHIATAIQIYIRDHPNFVTPLVRELKKQMMRTRQKKNITERECFIQVAMDTLDLTHIFDFEVPVTFLVAWHQCDPVQHKITDDLFQLIPWQHLRSNFLCEWAGAISKSLESDRQRQALQLALAYVCNPNKGLSYKSSLRAPKHDLLSYMTTLCAQVFRSKIVFTFDPVSDSPRMCKRSVREGLHIWTFRATIDDNYFTIYVSVTQNKSARFSLLKAGRYTDIHVTVNSESIAPPVLDGIARAAQGDYVDAKVKTENGKEEWKPCRIETTKDSGYYVMCLERKNVSENENEDDNDDDEEEEFFYNTKEIAPLGTKTRGLSLDSPRTRGLMYYDEKEQILVRVRALDLVTLGWCDQHKKTPFTRPDELLTRMWTVAMRFDFE